MANARAIANGNWSATSTWNGGVLPGNGDTVYSNGFTITIDQNVTIGGANNPIVNAGSFVSGQWYQITAVGTTSFTGIGASANTVGVIFQATGNGSGTGQATALATISTATNTAAGATTGGGGFVMSTAYNCDFDIRAGASIALDITAATGNSTLNAYNIIGAAATALRNSSGCSVTINQCNITATSGSVHALNNTGAGTITINSSILSTTANSGGCAINNNATGIITVNSSTLTPGVLNSQGKAINNASTGSVNVNNCTVTGSLRLQEAGIYNASTGSITASNCTLNGGPAIWNNSTGAITCINCTFTAVNGFEAVGSTSTSATNRFSGTFISSANGTQPINATRWILNSSPSASYIQLALDGINSTSFVRYFTADTSLGQANPTDVRSGVTYASGNLTGRLTVPARGSVALSVNYGPSMPFTATRSGTTATATLSYSYPLVVGDNITVTGASNAEWNGSYTIASVVSGTSVTFTVPSTYSATAGTGATMQTTGTAVLDPAAVASAVWGAATRTLTADLGPTAAQIRQELDANSTKLANLDTTVSSRLAPSGTLARVTLTDTVTTLTNAPASVTPNDIWGYASRTLTTSSGPTAVENAAAVRTNLATELARLDAPVSGATAPSAAAVASQVRTELTPELAKVAALVPDRLAQVSTVATTGAQLAAALS